jgi:phosphoserine phosphatase/NAD-dependent SIR2 family protein deacetylase
LEVQKLGKIVMTHPLPETHAEWLARLLTSDQLVLFVGAGISHQAAPLTGGDDRLPLWRELATKVAATCGEDVRNYQDSILDLFDAIAANQSRGTLEDAVRKALPDRLYEPSPVHSLVTKFPWHFVYTTNYDNLLARALGEQDPIDDEKKYEWLSRQETLRRPRLIHLHGTLQNLKTLSGSDYNKWEERNPVAYANLQSIVLNKTILFVGYSFSDPHLKSGLLPWMRQVTKGRGRRHYAWMWQPTPEQVKLLDKRDLIEAIPIMSDADWADAFRQVEGAINRIKAKGTTSAKRRRGGDTAASVPGDVIVNGYKLFFFRTRRQMSLRRLSIESDVSVQKINNLEQVKVKRLAGPSCFKTATNTELSQLEKALDCRGELEFGGRNDFLATYIMYYKVNHGKKARPEPTGLLDFSADTKAVIFDFGGTLTKSSSPTSTWERMWLAVGYQIEDAGHLHRQFVAGNISHQQWCDMTCRKLRERKFSKDTMRQIISGIEPVAGLAETLSLLDKQGTSLHIVSGSVREIILDILGDSWELFREIKANEFIYDENEIVEEIRGHQFDFEGKAKFISRVVEDRRCSPLEVLFVGNSLNDSWASLSGARTLCVNPTHVDYSDTKLWTDYIREMTDLRQILPFTKRVNSSSYTLPQNLARGSKQSSSE